MNWSAFYTSKDRPGRRLSCTCVPRGAAHEYCEECLFLVGPEHREPLLYPYRLPRVVDSFDELTGRWLRELRWLPAGICSLCKSNFAAGRFSTTLRISTVPPAERKAKVLEWVTRTGTEAPRQRHLGGFLRAASLQWGD